MLAALLSNLAAIVGSNALLIVDFGGHGWSQKSEIIHSPYILRRKLINGSAFVAVSRNFER
jgi:hypothetical protein